MGKSQQTTKQKERQQPEYRTRGKYAKVNPCNVCGKSAGVDYLSDHRTDTTDSAGNHWGDIALCLCGKCATRLADLPDQQAYEIVSGKREA